ncbi:chemotaxis protein CheW [Halobacillus shinanisalinarum]|uniref:Chemotaxis protein CheW n=1 Tax=Halobacillus shinanisalinarum TaxID=2932258 RepID=A0ABY4GZ89_9BACI|nr:chemotaxis protein CheW [Halobacillus shinanisalinarum]UOQ93240.1 chemotaxis protein CheW [Halobacillus shinanisalinarum]
MFKSDEIVQHVKVIVFQIEDEEYAIPVHQVGSIERIMHITRVPKTAPFVEGVINLRGVVTPIIDLRKRFGLQGYEQDGSTRIIIAAIDEMDVGLIVDGANDVLDIKEGAIQAPPEIVGTIETEYIDGIINFGQRLLILLNLDKVLSRDEVRELHEFNGQTDGVS